MLKNILLGLAALFAGVTCLAADLTPMSPEDTQKAIHEIISACAEIKSLQADFTQERSNSMLSETLISKGKMYYQEGRLRWEYTSPAAFLFVSDGANTVLKSGDGIQKIDASSNRIYKRIAGMIRGSLTGEALSGPLKRNLRQMYKSVRMHFDKDLKVVQVDLIENNGQTVIHICNAQYNKEINPEYFSVPQ